jgi:hypothetical protein
MVYEVCHLYNSLANGGSFLGDKQAGVRNTPLYSVEARNEWSNTYTPLHTFIACTRNINFSK